MMMIMIYVCKESKYSDIRILYFVTLRSVYFPFVVYVTLFIDIGSQDIAVGVATGYGLEFEFR
jgi:hypothetical protein